MTRPPIRPPVPDVPRRPPVGLGDRLTPVVVRVLGPPMRALIERFSHRREHRGFRILTLLPANEGMNEAAAARVTLALDLVAACDPRRFARIRRDMPVIRVVRTGGGFYELVNRACVVDWTAIMWHPVTHLAETIVHEATHARLHRMGVGHPRAWTARIERRCLREEVAFARRVPDGGAWAASLEARMESQLATEWWQPHRAIERSIHHARAERMPGWLVGWLERRQARLAREAAARARRHDPEPPA